MRLLKLKQGNKLCPEEFYNEDEIPPYAILSHRWGLNELSLEDLRDGTGRDAEGFSKVLFCGKQAAKDGLDYFWVDTCCINQSSTTEVSEAINSMFAWYQNSRKCYAYLSDVQTSGAPRDIGVSHDVSEEIWMPAFRGSKWFTRGWTLQELIAPKSVEFFSAEGDLLGNKISLAKQIHEVTGINMRVLNGTPLSQFSVDERLSWAANRITKRPEDKAYSLLGIFGIHMSLIYGEGLDRAMSRLREEIIKYPDFQSPGTLPPSSFNELDTPRKGKYEQRTDPTGIFDASMCRFKELLASNSTGSLLPELTGNKEMSEHILNQCKSHLDKHAMASLYPAIQNFARKLEPFLELTHFFVTWNVEWARTAWGAIELVLAFGSKFGLALEKLVNMFEKVTNHLKEYEKPDPMILGKIKRQDNSWARLIESSRGRISKSLGYVYSDIMGFCHECCNIFLPRNESTRCNPAAMSSTTWTPFHIRFQWLLDQLSELQDFYVKEMALIEQREGEFQGLKQDNDLLSNDQSRKRNEDRLQRLRFENNTTEFELLERFSRIENQHLEIWRSDNRNGQPCTHQTSYVGQILSWISSPQYTLALQEARNVRLFGTGEWFLHSEPYVKWKKAMITPGDAPSEPVCGQRLSPVNERGLFIKAKPGYGKTTLSSLIIEDLRRSTSFPVLYFHFTSRFSEKAEPTRAFRAALRQLVESNDTHGWLLDGISLLMYSPGADGYRASNDDILTAMRLCFNQISGIMLIDGVDECAEPAELLHDIKLLVKDTGVKIIALGRPAVDLSEGHSKSFTMFELVPSKNLEDIRKFLMPRIRKLQASSKLPMERSLQDLCESLASKAQGMFLWARVMMNYLEYPGHSPRERMQAILASTSSEDLLNSGSPLSTLYSKILERLSQEYGKSKILRIFNILIASFRPLSWVELRQTLAVRPGQTTTSSDLIVNFKEELPIICCALVEVRSDDSVTFIHSSVREFLLSNLTLQTWPEFSINTSSANMTLSTILLSYLIMDTPASPLGGSSSAAADPKHLSAALPLLDYALNWQSHACKCLEEPDLNLQSLTVDIAHLLRLLDLFLRNSLVVSAWIESSWTFGRKPCLFALSSGIGGHEQSLQILHSGISVFSLILRLKELSRDLKRLDTEWGRLLQREPNAIWGPSVTAFTKSPFWVETMQTSVKSLANSVAGIESLQRPDSVLILIRSQVSQSLEVLGVLSAVPSRGYVNASHRLFREKRSAANVAVLTSDTKKLIEELSQGWRIRFQQWSLKTNEQIFSLEAELPRAQIFNVLVEALRNGSHGRFPFPVCFSPDLNSAVILQSVITVDSNTDRKESNFSIRIQDLSQSVTSEIAPGTRYSSEFSPTGDAIALMSGENNTKAIHTSKIYFWSRDLNLSSDVSEFVFKSKFHASFTDFEYEYDQPTFITFHPSLPLLGISEYLGTGLWCYRCQKPNERHMVRGNMGYIKFSDCGEFLLFRRYQIIQERSNRDNGIDFFGYSVHIEDIVSKHQGCLQQPHRNSQTVEDTLAIRSPSSQNLHKDETNGAVLLGSGASVSLALHLPKTERGENTFVSLLDFSRSEDTMRFVWNMAQQRTYSISDHPNPHVPAIIDCTKSVMRRYRPELPATEAPYKRRKIHIPEETEHPGRQGKEIAGMIFEDWAGHYLPATDDDATDLLFQ